VSLLRARPCESACQFRVSPDCPAGSACLRYARHHFVLCGEVVTLISIKQTLTLSMSLTFAITIPAGCTFQPQIRKLKMLSTRQGAAACDRDVSPPPLSTKRSCPALGPGPNAGGLSARANDALYESCLARRMRRVEWELEAATAGGSGCNDASKAHGRAVNAATAARECLGGAGGAPAGVAAKVARAPRAVAWAPDVASDDTWAASGPKRVGLVSWLLHASLAPACSHWAPAYWSMAACYPEAVLTSLEAASNGELLQPGCRCSMTRSLLSGKEPGVSAGGGLRGWICGLLFGHWQI
jgi:hypothetical protein